MLWASVGSIDMAIRRARSAWIGASAVTLLLVLAGSGCGTEESNGAATASASSSPSSSAASTPSASAAPSPTPVIPEEPQPAPVRGDPNAALGLEGYEPVQYPDAFLITDQVLAAAGPGWSVEVAAGLAYPYDERWTQAEAVLYLVSPDEVHYEVGVLPEHMWADARVVSWIEDDALVSLTWAGGWESARYDLSTGVAQDIVLTSYGQEAYATMFVAADAEGNELWSAESDAGTTLHRWDATTSQWSASSLLSQHPAADAWWETERWRTEVADDGAKVVLHVDSAPDTFSGEFVVYDLTTDTSDTFTVPALVGSTTLSPLYGITDDTFVINWFEGLAAYDLQAGTTITLNSWDSSQVDVFDWDRRVGWGLPTDPDASYWWCAC